MAGHKSKLRKERKKKKLNAYLEVAKLNEADEERKKHSKAVGLSHMALTSNEDGPPFKKSKEQISLHCKLPKIKCLENRELNDGFSRGPEDSTTLKHDASEVDIDELRKAYRERRRKLSKLPTFRLKESGEVASFYTHEDHRIPLFMVDIQHLIMWSLLGHHAPFDPPRWYTLLKFNKLSHTVVLLVDNVSVDDLLSAVDILHLPLNTENGNAISEEFNPKTLFPWKLELVGPSTYGSNFLNEMATIPLSNSQYDKVISYFGSLENAVKGKAVYKVFRAMFPIKFEETNRLEEPEETNGKDKFPRTRLLLSAGQMVEYGYPLPFVKSSDPDTAKQPVITSMNDERLAGSLGEFLQSDEFRKNVPSEETEGEPNTDAEKPCVAENTDDTEIDDDVYVLSRPWYKEVGPYSPLFSVDCEMCMTTNKKLELTRITIVNEDLKVIYESFVKPRRKITNYLTRYSGITHKMLQNVTTRLSDVQRDIQNLLPPDAILIGQSLNSDLHAMKMMHPYVIDTSISFNLSGVRLRRSKLATLSRLFLSEEIQCWGSKGHDSEEDAIAAMKLVLLKLSKNLCYGDAVLEGYMGASNARDKLNESNRKRRIAKDIGISTDCKDKTYATSIFSHVKRGQHSAIVVGLKENITEYQDYVEEGLSQLSSKEGEKSTANILSVENSREIIPRACEVMLDHDLCIIHATRNCVDEKISELEKWCKKIVNYAATNSLIIVVFGGTKTDNGCCMIHLKKADINVIESSS